MQHRYGLAQHADGSNGDAEGEDPTADAHSTPTADECKGSPGGGAYAVPVFLSGGIHAMLDHFIPSLSVIHWLQSFAFFCFGQRSGLVALRAKARR